MSHTSRGSSRNPQAVEGIPTTILIPTVASMAHGGYGVARLDDGPVVFIEGAVPGDENVEVVLDHGRSRTRLWWGRARAIQTPSPWRRGAMPACPAAQRGAGCCDLPSLHPHASAYAKGLIVADQLARIAHLRGVDVATTVLEVGEFGGGDGSARVRDWRGTATVGRVVSLTELAGGKPEALTTRPSSPASALLSSSASVLTIQPVALAPDTGWRTRVRLAVDANGSVGYRAHRSHAVIPLDATHPCTQIDPRILRSLDSLAGKVTEQLGLQHDGEKQPTAVRHQVVAGRKGNRSRRAHHTGRGSEVELLLGVDSDGVVTAATSGARGESCVLSERSAGVYRVEDQTFTVAPDGFWQAHRAAATVYRQIVRDFLHGTTGTVGWDLYGGVGLFADVIAEYAAQVDSVDIAAPEGERSTEGGSIRFVRGAVGDDWSALLHNPPGARNTTPGARNNPADSGRAGPNVAGMLGTVDIVVLDPPRTGAGAEVIAQVAQRRPAVAVHIACDPAAGARDLAAWVANGYAIDQIVVVDAFPGTHHMETLVRLVPAQL